MVVFPECKRVLDEIRDAVLPCAIEVISSVEFQVKILKSVQQYISRLFNKKKMLES